MRAWDEQTATENVRCLCFIVYREKLREIPFPPPAPLYVLGLKDGNKNSYLLNFTLVLGLQELLIKYMLVL